MLPPRAYCRVSKMKKQRRNATFSQAISLHKLKTKIGNRALDQTSMELKSKCNISTSFLRVYSVNNSTQWLSCNMSVLSLAIKGDAMQTTKQHTNVLQSKYAPHCYQLQYLSKTAFGLNLCTLPGICIPTPTIYQARATKTYTASSPYGIA